MRKKLIHIILIIIGILIISSFVSAAGNIISCSDLNSKDSIETKILLLEENVKNLEKSPAYGSNAELVKKLQLETMNGNLQACRNLICNKDNLDFFNLEKNECSCSEGNEFVASSPEVQISCCDVNTQIVHPISGKCITCTAGRISKIIDKSSTGFPITICECPEGMKLNSQGVCADENEDNINLNKISGLEKDLEELNKEIEEKKLLLEEKVDLINENELNKETLKNDFNIAKEELNILKTQINESKISVNQSNKESEDFRFLSIVD